MTDQQMIAVRIPIDQIRPDPAQPRRLLPRDLAESLSVDTSPSEILLQLRERSRHNKWIRERVEELDGLADSIAADGLMQPIRVIPDGENAYHIEAGERRWWAHHILIGRGDSRFDSIAAFVIQPQNHDQGTLRRRVAENVHRSGFTAIELARAMATRAEEIAAEDSTLSRREIEERVGKENGMSDRRVRQFLGLLNLRAEVQEIAQQARLTEGGLRTLVTIKDPVRQLNTARALIRPKAKRASVHNRLWAEGRKDDNRLTNRLSKKRRFRSKATGVQSLIMLAKKMQTQNAEMVGKQLKKMLANSSSERDAILHLQGVLNLGLAVSAEDHSPRRQKRANDKQGKGKTPSDD